MKKFITTFTTALVLSSVFYVAPAAGFCRLYYSYYYAWEYGGETGNGCYWYRNIWASLDDYIYRRPPKQIDYRLFIYDSVHNSCPTSLVGD